MLGTRHALDAAREAGAERFLHLSSVTVFSFDFPDGVTEAWPVRANGVPYVDTKVAAEAVVLGAHAAGEVTCTIVRPATSTGPGRGRGRCSRSRSWPAAGSSCRRWAAASSARSTSTTSWTASCSRPPATRGWARCSCCPTGPRSPAASSSATTDACSAAACRCCPPGRRACWLPGRPASRGSPGSTPRSTPRAPPTWPARARTRSRRRARCSGTSRRSIWPRGWAARRPGCGRRASCSS